MIKKHFNLTLFLLTFILGSSFFIYSDINTGHTVFKRYGLENGLSQMTVYAITQDSLGFMWFGTQDGLNRFDGYKFKTFKHDPDQNNSISNSFITVLFVDRAGKLWIGSRGGLSQYNYTTENFLNFQIKISTEKNLSNLTVLTIDQDSEGKLWLGTDGNGLIQFDTETKKFQHIQTDSLDIRNTGNNIIRKILFINKDELLVGTHGAGLKLFNKNTGIFHPFGNKQNAINKMPGLNIIQSIYKRKDGTLWIGTESGLSIISDPLLNIKKNTHSPKINFGYNNIKIHKIIEHNDNIWFGTNKGLFRFEKSQNNLIHYKNDPQNPYSLSNNSIHCLFLDRSDVLWIGTNFGGICMLNLDNLKFKIFRHDKNKHNSVNNDLIRALYHSKRSGLYIGTGGGGLDHYEPLSDKAKHYLYQEDRLNSISNNDISTITEDQSGFIWIGTEYGLNRFDPKNKKFRHYYYDDRTQDSLSNNIIKSLCIDSNNKLWIATSKGLNKFNSKTNQFKRYLNIPGDKNSLSDNNILCLTAIKNGNLWIGTDANGANLFDSKNEVFHRYTKASCDLSNNSILCIYEESVERVWIGTFGGGLNLLNSKTGKVKHFSEKDGLANNVIYGILMDNHNNLWLSTNLGLSRLNTKNYTFKNFDVKNGLQSNEFNQGAFYQKQNGEMLFGGLSGFIAFYPNQFKKDLSTHNVYLTNFRLFNEPVLINADDPKGLLKQSIITTDAIKITHLESLISFEFSALHFKNPEKIKYAYLLEGWDKDWIETDSDRRIATYTKLKPGKYIFKVKVSKSDGDWSPVTRDVKINVLPPLWQTWWAYMIYLISFFGLLYIWKLQQQKRAKILKIMVDQRTKELSLSNKKLENLSITDGLTGLGNRRYLTKFIENETKLVNREYNDLNKQGEQLILKQKALLFLLLDIDFFKQVNDTYGHNAGDMVLKQIKGILEKNSRESDILIRWGGEEFLIIYRNVQTTSGDQIAENLRLAIEKHPFDIGKNRIIHKTGSFGFAAYPFFAKHPTKFSWEDIINIADKALYVSKNSGRNSWTGYLEPENIDIIPDDYLENILHNPKILEKDKKLKIYHSKQTI